MAKQPIASIAVQMSEDDLFFLHGVTTEQIRVLTATAVQPAAQQFKPMLDETISKYQSAQAALAKAIKRL